jgi:hypothetical protein
MKRRTAIPLVVLVPAAAQQHGGHSAASQAVPAALKFFTPAQNALVDTLSEMIIPADRHSGGAREAKVAAYIDDVLAGLPDADRQEFSKGLAAVEAESRKRYKKPFGELDDTRRDAILRDMAAGEENPKTDLERFFTRIKRLTLSGYYTSSVGLLKDLQYKGIMPIAAYPPCEHPDHQPHAKAGK